MSNPTDTARTLAQGIASEFIVQWPALTQLTGIAKTPTVEDIARVIDEALKQAESN